MRAKSLPVFVTTLWALAGQGAATITLDLTSQDSIKSAASTIAKDMMKYYTGNNPGDTPGNLPDPYYWWEAGAMFGTMINHWHYTGDTSYNAIIMQAMLHQAGDNGDFQPLNQTKTLGNDDQGFWGMAAMTAAEVNFENPPSDQHQWLALAQGVFNTQVVLYDSATCNGGFRWQKFTFNSGYNYKNSISNGCFFNLAARLAMYTGNATYAQWAEKTWDWMTGVGLLVEGVAVYDGTQNTDNCTSKDHNQWSYNAGIFLFGAAAMYNYSNGDSVWQQRTQSMLNTTDNFFADGIMYESCESTGKCNVDQRSFKAYLARWLAATSKIAPFTASSILPLLATSANAAIKTCTGGTSGTQCGLKWNTGTNDGSLGVGESMAALEIVQSNLVSTSSDFVSTVKGTGSSVGNANAGTSAGSTSVDGKSSSPVTTGDRAGAGILTALVLVGVLGGSALMISP
ncbi:mannan endo-1,6-alpha-mannosidase-2 [Coleophoma cylindrospora]|uniref:Mannan endo-1,6-alpha-mannosidase n=1 Tax=Coleophoma cylindrospora TaxID=1849047 RepID=A0A3D8RHH5_9HELO|nr:mannan endo-1,6-alpha-mannosidase-2 [Coleophoma cylindrospora]